MSDVVIRAEGLGKKFQIGSKQPYHRFSEVLTGLGSAALNAPRRWISGSNPEENPMDANQNPSEFWALKDINFEVKQGDALGIIGRNGAGKSTLLKLLSRITEPTEGRFGIKGRVGSLLEVGTGFHLELTGRENIYLSGVILGMTQSEIRNNFDEIVDFSGVEKFLDTPVKRFSSGMQVRLGFAVAAHLNPEILIVDEVLAVGDAEFQKKCLKKMSDVSSNGRTVIVVSHIMPTIQRLCKKCCFLDQGQLNFFGNTEEAITKYLDESSGTMGGNEHHYEDDFKKLVQLSSIRLTNEKFIPKSSFTCDEEIVIRITVTVRESLPGLSGYLEIRRQDGVLVLSSSSNDDPQSGVSWLKTGVHEIVLKMPRRILGIGHYEVSLSFLCPNHDNRTLDLPGNVLSFQISDPNTIRGNDWRGLLSTILTWEHMT